MILVPAEAGLESGCLGDRVERRITRVRIEGPVELVKRLPPLV